MPVAASEARSTNTAVKSARRGLAGSKLNAGKPTSRVKQKASPISSGSQTSRKRSDERSAIVNSTFNAATVSSFPQSAQSNHSIAAPANATINWVQLARDLYAKFWEGRLQSGSDTGGLKAWINEEDAPSGDANAAHILEEILTEHRLVPPSGSTDVLPPSCPSIGSLLHEAGICKPCVFANKNAKTCRNDRSCYFCHRPHRERRKKRNGFASASVHQSGAVTERSGNGSTRSLRGNEKEMDWRQSIRAPGGPPGMRPLWTLPRRNEDSSTAASTSRLDSQAGNGHAPASISSSTATIINGGGNGGTINIASPAAASASTRGSPPRSWRKSPSGVCEYSATETSQRGKYQPSFVLQPPVQAAGRHVQQNQIRTRSPTTNSSSTASFINQPPPSQFMYINTASHSHTIAQHSTNSPPPKHTDLFPGHPLLGLPLPHANSRNPHRFELPHPQDESLLSPPSLRHQLEGGSLNEELLHSLLFLQQQCQALNTPRTNCHANCHGGVSPSVIDSTPTCADRSLCGGSGRSAATLMHELMSSTASGGGLGSRLGGSDAASPPVPPQTTTGGTTSVGWLSNWGQNSSNEVCNNDSGLDEGWWEQEMMGSLISTLLVSPNSQSPEAKSVLPANAQ